MEREKLSKNVVSQHQLRAEMSRTQKKIYVASSNVTSSSRLFKSVGDFSHCKNLFGKANNALHFADLRQFPSEK